MDRIIRCSIRSQGLPTAAMEPVAEGRVSTLEERKTKEREMVEEDGSEDIGLPSSKSLFHLQVERILCVQRLAAQATNEASPETRHWYRMTSPFTDDATRKFFGIPKYFGLEADQITFFQQDKLVSDETPSHPDWKLTKPVAFE